MVKFKKKSLSGSSKRWIQRHHNDDLVLKAKSLGFRSRAVFKLDEIDKKIKFLKKKDNILDLGASPSCNWIINHLLPKYDEDNQQFVEPNLPNKRIGIMHLAGGYFVNDVDIREDKSIEINLQTLNDSNVFKSLRFNIGKI